MKKNEKEVTVESQDILEFCIELGYLLEESGIGEEFHGITAMLGFETFSRIINKRLGFNEKSRQAILKKSEKIIDSVFNAIVESIDDNEEETTKSITEIVHTYRDGTLKKVYENDGSLGESEDGLEKEQPNFSKKSKKRKIKTADTLDKETVRKMDTTAHVKVGPPIFISGLNRRFRDND